MDVSEILKNVGDWVSYIFTWAVNKFSELGGGKLITLIILGIVFFFTLKITIKVLKIVLILLLISLFISVGYAGIVDLIR